MTKAKLQNRINNQLKVNIRVVRFVQQKTTMQMHLTRIKHLEQIVRQI